VVKTLLQTNQNSNKGEITGTGRSQF